MDLLRSFVLLSVVGGNFATTPCVPRTYEFSSFVCVCNSTYCDEYDPVEVLASGTVLVETSDLESQRFVRTQANVYKAKEQDNAGIIINVDPSVERQTIFGFGGAFTDAAGINIASLSEESQGLLINSYYDVNGLDYNIGRVNLGGCDFSDRPYTYADTPGENSPLEFFNLTVDDLVYKIPYVKQAQSLREEPIKMFASPWSAPAWMKSNNALNGQGYLLPEFYQAWADYFVRFLDEYKANGVEFWGLTAQNEPEDGLVPGFSFNCMGWNASTQREWIVENLGPSLENNGYGDVKLMILDDQRPLVPKWAREVFEDPRALDYVDGIAVHWYIDEFVPLPNALDIAHEEFPDKFILYTEACTGDRPWDLVKVQLGSWERAERYLHNILEDLNHWVVGWTDWNLALDLEGGPNWANNFVDAPIIVDRDRDEFLKNPMYFALGHISRFIPAESVIVGSSVDEEDGGLSYVAAKRPDGGIAVVVLNRSSNIVPLSINVLSNQERLDIDLEPRSFKSFVFW